MPSEIEPFNGSKAAIYVADRLLCILRDPAPVPWSNAWDFPGGGRENSETPFETLAREVWEEVGLTISPGDVVWSLNSPSTTERVSWFFVVKLANADVRFGDEGQGWAFLTNAGFLAREDAIPSLKDRLQRYLDGEAGVAFPG